MIDLIVVVQAVIAGLVLFRAACERNKWDRAGFALLACSAGLMTIRRVTASLDRYTPLDRVILPYVIAWIMLAAATCFAFELLHHGVSKHDAQPKSSGLGDVTKFVWPFALFFLMSASEFIPARSAGGVEKSADWTAEDALWEAMSDTRSSAAAEVARRHGERGIDVLRIRVGSGGQDEIVALQGLQALAQRVNTALQAHEAIASSEPKPTK